MDIVDRLFSLIDAQYKEQKDFALTIGVHPTRVSEWRKRKSASYQKRLPEIAKALNTTTEYLLTGNEAQIKSGDQSHEISEADIKAAFWGGEKDLSPEDLDAMWNDVKNFAAFVADKKRREKEGQK